MSKNLAADILHQTAPSRWADSQSTLLNKASPLPVLLRAHAAKAREELAEGRGDVLSEGCYRRLFPDDGTR